MNHDGELDDLLGRPFDDLPAAARCRVFGVPYARLEIAGAGTLYVTEFGWPVAQALLPENWYRGQRYSRHGERLPGGTGAVYRLELPHRRFGTVAVVIKVSRFARDVPLSVSSEFLPIISQEAIQAARFNSPFEEFGVLNALRRRRQAPDALRVLTKRPLAIFVTAEEVPLWRSGRVEHLFDQAARQQAEDQQEVGDTGRVELELLKRYYLLFGWVRGHSAEEMNRLGLIDETDMRALTARAIAELAENGYQMLDIKPRHLILRRRSDGTLLRRNGRLVYALIDFELLMPRVPAPREPFPGGYPPADRES